MIRRTQEELEALKASVDSLDYRELKEVAKEFIKVKGNPKKSELQSDLKAALQKAIEISALNKSEAKKEILKGKKPKKSAIRTGEKYSMFDKIKIKFVASIKFNYDGYKVEGKVGEVQDLPAPIANYIVKTLHIGEFV